MLGKSALIWIGVQLGSQIAAADLDQCRLALA
jgi:hypothetical protein